MKRLCAFAIISAVFLVLLGLGFNSSSNISQKQIQPWKIGYWIWAGEPAAFAAQKTNILYVQVQGAHWPQDLPAADEYIVVHRIESNTELTWQAASKLVKDYDALRQEGGDRVHLVGLQIDFDCATSKLKSYGNVLVWVRAGLPAGDRLSITALLDWFHGNTAIKETLAPVDEFVPQFYDVAATRSSSGIAEPIDPLKWAPILNAQKTPYR